MLFENNTNMIHEDKKKMGGCQKEMNNPCCEQRNGMVCPPVYECPEERVCHREIVHEVPQDCLRYVILDGISFVNVSKTYISAEYRSFFYLL